MLCLFTFGFVLYIMLMIFAVVSFGVAQAIGTLLMFAFYLGYGIYTEWRWRGQTVGKRVLRLRVVDVHGLRLKFSQVLIRNLLRPVDMQPVVFYLVGGLASLLNSRGQRLGDLVANTIVVRIPKLAEPNLDQLMADKFNSLRAWPHLEARLRQRVSPAEASIALQAIVRRDLLDPRARVELFAELAAHFKGKVQFPAEAVEGITDEQYMRNVADCLFRPGRKPAARPQPDSEPAPAGSLPPVAA
jgi:uncharacterized RDD family membrane protein YckC